MKMSLLGPQHSATTEDPLSGTGRATGALTLSPAKLTLKRQEVPKTKNKQNEKQQKVTTAKRRSQ